MIHPKFLSQALEFILVESKAFLQDLENGEIIESQGAGFGGLNADTEIRADKQLGEYVLQTLQTSAKDLNVGLITIEGFDPVIADGLFWYAVDPLDGSLNYKLRNNTIGLPYTCAITVLQKCKDAIFSDVVAAGVIDLRSGDLFIAHKEGHGYKSFVNDMPAKTTDTNSVDISSAIAIGEMYYPENRQLLIDIFKGQKGWLRNPGSAAYEMALVASGTAFVYICDRQKQHELGAGYALVKGAGGVVVDFEGKDLADTGFLFNTQTPVVLAANETIAQEIIDRIKQSNAK